MALSTLYFQLQVSTSLPCIWRCLLLPWSLAPRWRRCLKADSSAWYLNVQCVVRVSSRNLKLLENVLNAIRSGFVQHRAQAAASQSTSSHLGSAPQSHHAWDKSPLLQASHPHTKQFPETPVLPTSLEAVVNQNLHTQRLVALTGGSRPKHVANITQRVTIPRLTTENDCNLPLPLSKLLTSHLRFFSHKIIFVSRNNKCSLFLSLNQIKSC